MTTQLDCYKAAARKLQQGGPNVLSPVPSTPMSRAFNSSWRKVVERCLNKTSFNFAMKRGILTRTSVTPDFGFAYYYQKPSDCIRIIYLSATGYDFTQPMPPDSYAEEKLGIATDAAQLFGRWVTREAIDAPGMWDESFAYFVEVELALEAAPIVNTSVIEALTKERTKAEKEAISISAAQSTRRQRRSGSWSTANRRRSRGGWGPGSAGSLNGAPEQN